jgi:2-polyprenyl-3-methyl-5-hydroxy-6-metoxy-1,4-benzoquinol methylase
MIVSSDSMISPQKALFEQRATTYSGNFSGRLSGTTYSFQRRLEIATEFSTPFRGRLLECASGTGEITDAILASGRFQQATVVDLSTNMLGEARGRLQRLNGQVACEFLNQDIFTVQTAPHAPRYDLILCLGLIAHTGRLTQLLTHLSGLLAPGGGIVLQSSLMDHVGNRMKRLLTAKKYARTDGYGISYFTSDDIAEGAAAAGLTIDRSRRYRMGIPFGNRIWPAGTYRAERLLDGLSKRFGGEAIYLLRKRPGV